MAVLLWNVLIKFLGIVFRFICLRSSETMAVPSLSLLFLLQIRVMYMLEDVKRKSWLGISENRNI
jgi:hypothetical protein